MKYIKTALRFYNRAKTSIIRIMKKWRASRAPLYLVLHVEDLPDKLTPYVLYLIGKPGKEWLVGFICPCGCKQKIELVLNGRSPSWNLVLAKDGKPSLFPSVFRSVGCRSHFFLENGRIRWCK
jgi:Family of unknown function (DUF6527)